MQFRRLRLLGIDHPRISLTSSARTVAYRFSRRFGHALHRLTHRPPQIAAQAPPSIRSAGFHPR